MNGFNLLKPVCGDTHVSAHSGCAKKKKKNKPRGLHMWDGYRAYGTNTPKGDSALPPKCTENPPVCVLYTTAAFAITIKTE